MAGKRFYNAGDKIDETLAYSIPTGQDVHCIARYPLICPREDFFTVPTSIEIQQTGESLSVQFAKDVTRKFGNRGVVAIDPEYDAEKEDPEMDLEKYPFAANDKDAVLRGNELWNRYLRKVVESHLNDCESARAAGGAPRSAQGFTKRAMKLLKIQDPGEQYFNSLANGGAGQTRGTDPVVAALQAQNQMIMTMLMQLIAGKNVDPDALKKLAETPNAVGLNDKGEVVTSGIATGKINKPIAEDHDDGVPLANKNPRGSKDRRTDAEKQF